MGLVLEDSGTRVHRGRYLVKKIVQWLSGLVQRHDHGHMNRVGSNSESLDKFKCSRRATLFDLVDLDTIRAMWTLASMSDADWPEAVEMGQFEGPARAQPVRKAL